MIKLIITFSFGYIQFYLKCSNFEKKNVKIYALNFKVYLL